MKTYSKCCRQLLILRYCKTSEKSTSRCCNRWKPIQNAVANYSFWGIWVGASFWGSEIYQQTFKNEQNQRKSLGLFFAGSGTGKFVREDLYSKINANPCVYFFSEPQIEAPTCVLPKFSIQFESSSRIRHFVCKIRCHFWKWRLQKRTILETLAISHLQNVADSWLGLACWLACSARGL